MSARTPKFDKRILAEIAAQKRSVFAGLACSAGSAVLLGLTTWLIKFTLGAVQDGDTAMLQKMSFAVILIFGMRYFLTRGQLYFLSKAANRLTAELRARLFEKLQRLPIRYFNERRSGAIQSVLTNDVNVFQSAINAVRDGIDGPIKVVVGFVAIFTIQWQLALISLAITPFMAFFIQRNARKMRVAQEQVQDDLSHLTAMMHEQLQGTRVVKAFGAEGLVVSRFRQLVERTFASQMKAVRRVATLKPMVELIGAVALAITVFVCGSLVSRGQLQVAELGAFIYALDVIVQGAKNLGGLNQTMAQVSAASNRIYREVLDVPETTSDAPDAIELERSEGRIEFKNVGFVYPDGTRALEDVSFVVEPGSSLALVGPSGAGKSTIADLLLRFYDPTEGEILYDGVDIRKLKSSWYRGQIGVVPQQTFLFAGSIRENLLLGAPDADGAQVLAAAHAAHAHEFVTQMPEGYETVLGERGVRTSGGEAQRLAIARALIRNPKLLLLDEATSNLDAESERIVTQALDEAMANRTTVFIAHRLTTAARANTILMLRRGKIVERGSHTELVASGGAYAGMYRAFSSGVLDGTIG